MPPTSPSCTARWLAAAVLAALAFFAAAAPAQVRAAGPESFGIAVGGAIQNEDALTLAKDLDAIRDVGSKWIRIDINWSQIQAGGPASYEWGAIDRLVQAATARGMKVLGVIQSTPEWARPPDTSSRYGPDPGQYAAFAGVAVQHYSAMGVHAYEVWNEPNSPSFWAPRPDVAAYTEVLKAAYPAIKAADPQATVLSGGTAPAATTATSYSPVDFLSGIYANGGGLSFDAVSHHPYCWPAVPGEAQNWSAWYQMYGTSPSLRSVMIDHGDGAKKIWGTEFGAPTNGPPGSYVGEAEQASMITRAYELWMGYEWAGPLFTYQGRDLGTETSTRENFFGLLRNDFSPKPAFAAYQAAAARAASTDGGGSGGSTGTGGGVGTPAETNVTVKGSGRGRGGGKVKGRVSTTAATTTLAGPAPMAAKPAGRIQLRLYVKARGGKNWRPVSRARAAKLSGQGRFKLRLRKLERGKIRSGSYRVRAHYTGSNGAPPATSWSPRFKIRR